MTTARPWSEMQERMPLLSRGERNALDQSIREYGVIYPVLTLPDGRIVDGHNRWELTGGDAPVKVINIAPASALVLGAALNLDRRQVTSDQRAEIRQRLAEDRTARKEAVIELRQQGWTQERVAETFGVGRSTVSDWESDEPASNVGADIACAAPDWRVRVPHDEHAVIAGRHDSGESQEAIAADYKVSRQRISQIITKASKQNGHAAEDTDLIEDVVPTDGYGVILADPPWEYTQRSSRLNGTTEDHYGTMGIDEIAALPVEDVAADDAVLMLWTTWPFLQDAFGIMKAWGFEYVTGLPWIKVDSVHTDFDGKANFKPSYGVGFWVRGCSEPILIGRRGKPRIDRTNLVGLLSENAAHSRKPAKVHELAERFGSPRLELFGRRREPGWTVLGNAVDGGKDIGDRLRELRATASVV